MNSVEILAPAGSYESMVAAINAGADAVYMGGSRFGARAYADNPNETQWLQAIDYAHLHGCRLYMTVNTLTKEEELEALYEYLYPYYRQGLDAVIVQDMGVFSYIKKQFPDLPIHASTQMTITGCHGAKILKELGASRIVTARELSLPEIAQIRDKVDIEIESFVHGALCYCYSGQCLLSSFIGGRSGNRGRCAQPCRLPYDVLRGKITINIKEEQHVLSLKDLCTLNIIPEMIAAGVYSMKIEGRMKSPRYTAGVVSIYRKYVDQYLKHGRGGFSVDPKDQAQLLDLFDRGGLTEGYYRQHNGKDMIALKEKPAFRAANQELFDYLDETYVNQKKQEPVYGFLELTEGKPSRLDLWMSREDSETDLAAVTVTGAIVHSAKNQPLSAERLEKQMKKTGNTPFSFENLQIRLEGSCFVPTQELNELRRNGLKKLEEMLLNRYRREAVDKKESAEAADGESVGDKNGRNTENPHHLRLAESHKASLALHVSLEQPEQLDAVLAEAEAAEIYVDAASFAAPIWQDTVRLCHQAGKKCLLMLPHIFRNKARKYFTANLGILKEAGFDGLVIRSLEEVGFLNEQGVLLPLLFDYTMYGMNHLAQDYFTFAGAGRQTLPVELNSRELEKLGCKGKELIIYGYLPAMVSAQCIAKTTEGCRKEPGLLFLKDRMGKLLPVKNHCRFCYNLIYNTSPLSLFGMEELVKRLDPAVIRMQFTIESGAQVRELLHAYTDSFYKGRTAKNPTSDFTRGHFKRGIE